MRVVPDEDVDRVQVYRRRRPSRALLIARELSHASYFQPYCPCMPFEMTSPFRMRESAVSWREGCQSLLWYVNRFIQAAMAAGFHLFPFRTEKLSPPAPMVLQCNAGE